MNDAKERIASLPMRNVQLARDSPRSILVSDSLQGLWQKDGNAFTQEAYARTASRKPEPMTTEPTTGAEFSDCRKYRYALWRRWEWNGYGNQVMFIGLNPSTADETEDDPTIRRCINFAKSWGYSGIVMMNAYAFRATEPKVMKKELYPVGPANDEALAYRRTQVGLIVACWGAHCSPERERQVCKVIAKTIHCLGKTKAGRPKHPLYLKADTKPELFWEPSQ